MRRWLRHTAGLIVLAALAVLAAKLAEPWLVVPPPAKAVE